MNGNCSPPVRIRKCLSTVVLPPSKCMQPVWWLITKRAIFGTSLPLTQSFSETVLANFLWFAWKCAQELSNKGSSVLPDLVEAELRRFKADPKPSIRSIVASIGYLGTDWSSHTLGRSLAPMALQLVLLSSRRQDELFTVDGETNTSLVVDSVSL